MRDAQRTIDGPEVIKRLLDARDFIGTRMNHPDDYAAELHDARPHLMDTLAEAADEIERLHKAIESWEYRSHLGNAESFKQAVGEWARKVLGRE